MFFIQPNHFSQFSTKKTENHPMFWEYYLFPMGIPGSLRKEKRLIYSHPVW